MEARFQAVTGLSCLSHGLPKPHKTASHSVLKAYTFEDHFRRPFSKTIFEDHFLNMVFVFGGFLILSAGSALSEQIHHPYSGV